MFGNSHDPVEHPSWSTSASTVFELESTPSSSSSVSPAPCSRKDFGLLTVPPRLRDSPGQQRDFGWGSQIGLCLVCAFVSANLYYCQPLLIEMANSFHESYSMVAWMPTFYQAGYCLGLLFISPLGDLIRRRQLVLALISMTTCLSVGLALAQNLIAFHTLAVLIGVFNVTPQILLPLAADIAKPNKRSCAVSMLQSGIMLGILFARVLSGIIGYFTSWRMVYYVAIGVQAVALFAAYFVVPDVPPKNPDLTYTAILRSMATFAVTEPRLLQASLINTASVACWTNFWVTLTFLLGDDPYHFSTLWIGLFGLIGIIGLISAPLSARFIDRLGAWYAILIATLCLSVLQALETVAGGLSIAVVAIVCFGIDAFRQMQTVSLQTIVFSISEEARARLHAVLTFSLFAGQTLGSAAGSHVFLKYGWRAAACLSVWLYGLQLVILFARGPNCGRRVWFGYKSGFGVVDRKQCLEDGCAAPCGTNQGDRSEAVTERVVTAQAGMGTATEARTQVKSETEMTRQVTVDTCTTGVTVSACAIGIAI